MGLQGKTDDDLMKIVQLGNGDSHKAFECLDRKYRRGITHYIFLMVGDIRLAQEFAQDTFLKVYSKADSYKLPGNFDAWIYRIATNTAINHLRIVRRTPLHIDIEEHSHEIPDPRQSPERDFERSKMAEVVRNALAEIPNPYRQTLINLYYYNMNYAEAALAEGVEVGTIKSRFFRGKSYLKSSLIGILD